MDINDLTLRQIKEINSIGASKTEPYIVGEKYFIRTVTMYFTGLLEQVHDQELVLSSVAWIASTGRFSTAISSGIFDEVEPYTIADSVIIGRGAIIDAHIVKFALPADTK